MTSLKLFNEYPLASIVEDCKADSCRRISAAFASRQPGDYFDGVWPTVDRRLWQVGGPSPMEVKDPRQYPYVIGIPCYVAPEVLRTIPPSPYHDQLIADPIQVTRIDSKNDETRLILEFPIPSDQRPSEVSSFKDRCLGEAAKVHTRITETLQSFRRFIEQCEPDRKAAARETWNALESEQALRDAWKSKM